MRGEQEIFEMILEFAQECENVKVVTLEGSRVNPRVKSDSWQDYDLSFFVTNTEIFKKSLVWLERFGRRLFMQQPENMELFKPNLKEGWLSFLMLFDDGVRLDLKVIPIKDLEDYLKNERLMKVLLDKSSYIQNTILPSDKDFWIKPLTQRSFEDCSNEFYWQFACVMKARLRHETLLVCELLYGMRECLLIMMSWRVGLKTGFEHSLGKAYKFLPRFLQEKEYKQLLKTHQLGNEKHTRKALKILCKMFRQNMKKVALKARLTMPHDEENIKTYCDIIKKL